MSVRGTMTSRVRVSPSSKTERIISRSSSSMISDSLTRSTMSRSSRSYGPSASSREAVTRTSQPVRATAGVRIPDRATSTRTGC